MTKKSVVSTVVCWRTVSVAPLKVAPTLGMRSTSASKALLPESRKTAVPATFTPMASTKLTRSPLRFEMMGASFTLETLVVSEIAADQPSWGPVDRATDVPAEKPVPSDKRTVSAPGVPL